MHDHDITTEELIPLAEAGKLIPGGPVSPSTVYRYCMTAGLQGVRLEWVHGPRVAECSRRSQLSAAGSKLVRRKQRQRTP